MTPSVCPNCGADVPPKARACPECGADEKTGWSEDAGIGGLNLPDEEFNYDEFVDREFGGASPKPKNISWLWWIAALLLILAFIGGMIFFH